MKAETKTKKRRRSRYTDEFKAGAVQLVKEGRSATQVANDLGVHAASVYNWVRQAGVDAGNGPAGALTTDEKAELAALRKEVRVLQMERAILKNCLGGPSRRLLDEKLQERRAAPAPSRFERRRLMATSRRSPASSHGGSLASREQWPSTFWCSANP